MLHYYDTDFIILYPNQLPDPNILETYKLIIFCDDDNQVKEAVYTNPHTIIPSTHIHTVRGDEMNLHFDERIVLWVIVSPDNPKQIVGWLNQPTVAKYHIERLNNEREMLNSALKSISVQLQITSLSSHNSLRFGSSSSKQTANEPTSTLSQAFIHSDNEFQVDLTMSDATTSELVVNHRKYKDLSLDMKCILQLSQDLIFVSDGSGKALRVSASCKRFWGYEEENFIGKTVFALEKEGAFNPSATRLVLEKHESVQITQKTKTGKNLHVIGAPIKDDSGKIIRVINISKDITEISTLKDQLNKEKMRNESYRQKLNEILNQDGTSTFIYRSDEIANVLMTAYKISEFDSTVLLLGESGVGKEVIANYIHKCSKRANQPLIKINCGAIPENLLESELFGYEKGSFTGANTQGKPGLFEAAHQGTIFLDEIGEIPYPLQVKLLRVLQEKEITRIGGTRPIKVDVRVIAATNRDLAQEVQQNRFREDLYYRLNVVPIHIPPLRERRLDIIPLLMHYTERFNHKFLRNKHFSPESFDYLCAYHWPGNVRELQNIVERIIVTTDSDYIEPKHLPKIFQKMEDEIKKTKPIQHTKVYVKKNDNEKYKQIENSIEIPIPLVRNYRRLGMSHGEWSLFCTILSYKQNDQYPSPSENILAEHLQCSARQIRKWIHSIKEKNLLQVSRVRDQTNKSNANNYNFTPLLDASLEIMQK